MKIHQQINTDFEQRKGNLGYPAIPIDCGICKVEMSASW